MLAQHTIRHVDALEGKLGLVCIPLPNLFLLSKNMQQSMCKVKNVCSLAVSLTFRHLILQHAHLLSLQLLSYTVLIIPVLSGSTVQQQLQGKAGGRAEVSGAGRDSSDA